LFCQFGNNGRTPATVFSDTELTCSSPSFIFTSNNRDNKHNVVLLRLTNGIDYWSDSAQFYYEKALVITGIVPPRGSTLGGSKTTVVGNDFDPAENLMCKFGDGAGHVNTAYWLNATAVECTSPAVESVGPVQLSLTTNGVDGISNAMLFYYVSAPQISSIEPIVGPLGGGTRIKVEGVGFAAGEHTLCSFGGVQVASSFISSTEIICESPASVDGSDSANLRIR